MPVVFKTIILGGYIMIFGILFCVVVMVVPSVCVFVKANKDVVMDRTIYVGIKQN